MSEQDAILSSLVKAVAAQEILLHDDRQNLVSREELMRAISLNRLLIEVEPAALFKDKLVLPVDQADENMFHVAITLDFLNFNRKLVILGFPLHSRQKIAEMYYPLFWALSSDIDYEMARYKEEVGHEPSPHELAYLRVINEWAVANSIGGIEDRILRFEPEGNHQLQQLLVEVARRRGKIKNQAGFGFQENEIEKIIKEIWLPPFRYFQGREIKAFIDINALEWTREEARLLWGGHFDFALCDSNAVLQLVVEYDGTGHYGQSDKDKREVHFRDEAKRRICEKSGVPLFRLTSEFLFVNEYKEMLRALLFIFRMSPNKIDAQFLHDHAIELLRAVGQEQIEASRLDVRHISDILSKLDVYLVQSRVDMLLALLWEVNLAFGKNTDMVSILNDVKGQIRRGKAAA